MKLKYLLTMAVFVTSISFAEEKLPEQKMVKEVLEASHCPSGFNPTYFFTEIPVKRSYVLKNGRLELEQSTSVCPEGTTFSGSFCIEILCTGSVISTEE